MGESLMQHVGLLVKAELRIGLQRYIFPRDDTYLDTRGTIRYAIRHIAVRDKTSYQQLTLLLNNLFP